MVTSKKEIGKTEFKKEKEKKYFRTVLFIKAHLKIIKDMEKEAWK